MTEFGGNLSDSTWWTGTFLKVIGNHKISYVLGWRNAGDEDLAGEFEFYVPYKGHSYRKRFCKILLSMTETFFEKDIKNEKLYQ